MYNEYFGFKEAPFSIAPDPHYLYMTAQHREALAHLVYGLNSEGGCILLTGEVGTGKTTICRCLLEQIPEQAKVALLLNPKVTAVELLETICDEFNITYPDEENTIKTYIDLINAFLLESNARGEKTVLIIDEAQNLDSTVLEQLRLLTNLETNQRKLLQIIILGQPELLEILSREEMRQLAQRITARFHLQPLTRNELKAYISHRLAIAGQNIQFFPENVIKRIYQISKGIPRLINVICDRALLGTYVQGKPSVDLPTLNQAAKEIFGELKNQSTTYSSPKRFSNISITLAASVMVSLLFLFVFYADKPDSTTTIARNSSQSVMPVNDALDITAPQFIEPTMETTSASIETSSAEAAEAEKTPVEIEQTALIEREPPDTKADTLNKLIEDTADDIADSYHFLFGLWDKRYDRKTDGNACLHAINQGLSCLHRSGNLHSLRQLNRPAIIKIYGKSGKSLHAALTHLDAKNATIHIGANKLTIDVTILDTQWLGDYTLLWRKPPYYKNAVKPGNQGPIVQWIDQQLVRIYGQSIPPTISDIYSEKLVTQIKTFQQSKGLFPDGIAGPRTLIHLNNDLGLKAPQLFSMENTRES